MPQFHHGDFYGCWAEVKIIFIKRCLWKVSRAQRNRPLRLFRWKCEFIFWSDLSAVTSWSVLVTFQGNYPFHINYQVFWYAVVHYLLPDYFLLLLTKCSLKQQQKMFWWNWSTCHHLQEQAFSVTLQAWYCIWFQV